MFFSDMRKCWKLWCRLEAGVLMRHWCFVVRKFDVLDCFTMRGKKEEASVIDETLVFTISEECPSGIGAAKGCWEQS